VIEVPAVTPAKTFPGGGVYTFALAGAAPFATHIQDPAHIAIANTGAAVAMNLLTVALTPNPPLNMQLPEA
jgi:hypothetical protein